MAGPPRTLASVPAEIVVRIFQYCDSFADLGALFLTCRHAHSVWVANNPNIIWHVAPKLIPAFDRALMAVRKVLATVYSRYPADGGAQARATELVHAAFRDGLPPDIMLEEFTGASRKPDSSELSAVLDLAHLVRCIEARYCDLKLPEGHYFWNQNASLEESNYQRWPLDREDPPPVNPPEEPQGMGIWRERLHEAAYTSLLMGAVFFRAYNQPFYPETTRAPSSAKEADEETDKSRREIIDLLGKTSYRYASFSPFVIDEEKRDYLGRFPVFDLNDALGGQKETFSPFIKWFIQSAISKHRAEPPLSSRDFLLRDEARAAIDDSYRVYSLPSSCLGDGPETGGLSQWYTGGSPAEGEAVLWRLMQSIHMFEFILTCIANSDGKRRLGREPSKRANSLSGKTRTANVVLFGVFQAEEIAMPDNFLDAVHQQLLAHGTRPSETAASVSPSHLDIPLVLEELYMRSGIPNTDDGRPLPPPPLQLFTFTLRHHFNLRFHSYAFITPIRIDEDQDYHFFKNRATIFANGLDQVPDREWFDCTNGTEFLVEYHPPALLFCTPPQGYENNNPRTWVPPCFPEHRFYHSWRSLREEMARQRAEAGLV